MCTMEDRFSPCKRLIIYKWKNTPSANVNARQQKKIAHLSFTNLVSQYIGTAIFYLSRTLCCGLLLFYVFALKCWQIIIRLLKHSLFLVLKQKIVFHASFQFKIAVNIGVKTFQKCLTKFIDSSIFNFRSDRNYLELSKTK